MREPDYLRIEITSGWSHWTPPVRVLHIEQFPQTSPLPLGRMVNRAHRGSKLLTVRFQYLRSTKVSDLYAERLVKQKIFWLKVPVKHLSLRDEFL